MGNLADAVIESRCYINNYGNDILIKTLHHYLQPALNVRNLVVICYCFIYQFLLADCSQKSNRS